MPTGPSPRSDRFGLPLSTSSDQAAQAYRRGLDRLLSGFPGAEGHFREAINADPNFALARLALGVVQQEASQPTEAAASRESAAALSPNLDPRERQQIQLISRLAKGDDAAIVDMEVHLEQFPRDALIAEQVLRHVFFHGGAGKKNRVLQLLEKLAPAYGDDWYLLGRHAFHLQESEEFERAAALGERALGLLPENATAAHALIHVYQATGRHSEGGAFIRRWLKGYERGGRLYGHLWWHVSLMDLDAGRFEDARALLDAEVLDLKGPASFLALADAVGILWRLELYGVARDTLPWNVARDLARRVAKKPGRPFIDAHAGVAYVASGDESALKELIAALEAGTGGPTVRLLRGISAFRAGRYADAARELAVNDDELESMGGSDVERSLFRETLVEACLRGSNVEGARQALKPMLATTETPRRLFWLGRVQLAAGRRDQAVRSLQRAKACWEISSSGSPELNAINDMLRA